MGNQYFRKKEGLKGGLGGENSLLLFSECRDRWESGLRQGKALKLHLHSQLPVYPFTLFQLKLGENGITNAALAAGAIPVQPEPRSNPMPEGRGLSRQPAVALADAV